MIFVTESILLKRMKLNLIRNIFTPISTIGSLSIDGLWECYTLERVADGLNRKNESAIPCGSYKINLAYSEHFARVVPHLLEVPNRSDIEIHVANTSRDIHGCIGVGRTKSVDFIGESRLAMQSLMAKLSFTTGLITIEIEEKR